MIGRERSYTDVQVARPKRTMKCDSALVLAVRYVASRLPVANEHRAVRSPKTSDLLRNLGRGARSSQFRPQAALRRLHGEQQQRHLRTQGNQA